MSKISLQLTRQMQWALIPLLLLALTQQVWGQCNNASQYPSTSIDLAATNASGASTTITTCNFSGEYSVLINAVAGSSYRFTTSIVTDYFTIRSGSPGGPVVGSGTQPLSVTPGVSGTLYAHVNSSAACLTDVSCRQTAVQCTSCAGGGCINSTVYPALGISLNLTNMTGAAQQITTCQFSGEYYSVADVIASKSYMFSSSVGTDWITVRVGTFNGTILVQGAGSVAVAPSTTANLFIHNNANASCGTNATCRVSSVQCTNCDPTPPCIPSPTFPTNGSTACPTAMVTLSWPASVGATSYDVYFGTTAVPPFVGNVIPNSMTVFTPTVGTYFWRIAPRNASGPTTTCTTWSFTRQDITPPTIQCSNQTIIFNGETSIPLVQNDLVAATIDNCGIQSISLFPNSISSNQVGQIIPVLLTVTDINGNTSTCTSQITVNGLPSGWSQNINGVACANGNNIAYNASTEVWTATSTNCYYASPFTSDETAFAQRTLCGNGSITAQVTGISGTALGWAGVVMRESNAAGAKKAQLTTNMAGNQSRREFRVTTNGAAIPQNFPAQNRYWLRIVRSGNQLLCSIHPMEYSGILSDLRQLQWAAVSRWG
ncbi:MAG: HYR domain-containing protein [Saprospiraceae bacterium]|nr:HYR domain-containing protein [Saprospiraceae bacterium]